MREGRESRGAYVRHGDATFGDSFACEYPIKCPVERIVPDDLHAKLIARGLERILRPFDELQEIGEKHGLPFTMGGNLFCAEQVGRAESGKQHKRDPSASGALHGWCGHQRENNRAMWRRCKQSRLSSERQHQQAGDYRAGDRERQDG